MKKIKQLIICFGSIVSIADGFCQHSQALQIRKPFYSRLWKDGFATTDNPALLAGMDVFFAGAQMEQQYLMRELSQYSACVVLPTTLGSFGSMMHYYGNETYSLRMLSFGYARKLTSQMTLGLSFGYRHQQWLGYPPTRDLDCQIGFQMSIDPRLSLLAGWQRFVDIGQRDKYGFINRMIYAMGLGYDLTDHFNVSIRFSHEINHVSDMVSSLSYKIAEQVLVNVSMEAFTGKYGVSVLFRKEKMNLGISASSHQQLGISPGLSISYAGMQAVTK